MTPSIKRPSSTCATAGCSTTAAPGKHHCESCAKARARTRYRSREQAAYRDRRYVTARKRLLQTYGEQCWSCHRYPSEGNHASAHHIDGDNENNADTNLAVLCTSCHSTLEREVDRGDLTGPTHTALRETLEGLGRPVDSRFFGPVEGASRPSLAHTIASFDKGGVGGHG